MIRSILLVTVLIFGQFASASEIISEIKDDKFSLLQTISGVHLSVNNLEKTHHFFHLLDQTDFPYVAVLNWRTQNSMERKGLPWPTEKELWNVTFEIQFNPDLDFNLQRNQIIEIMTTANVEVGTHDFSPPYPFLNNLCINLIDLAKNGKPIGGKRKVISFLNIPGKADKDLDINSIPPDAQQYFH